MRTARVCSLALEFHHGPSCLPMGSDQTTTTEAFEIGTQLPHGAELADPILCSVSTVPRFPFPPRLSSLHASTAVLSGRPVSTAVGHTLHGQHHEHVLQDLR